MRSKKANVLRTGAANGEGDGEESDGEHAIGVEGNEANKDGELNVVVEESEADEEEHVSGVEGDEDGGNEGLKFDAIERESELEAPLENHEFRPMLATLYVTRA